MRSLGLLCLLVAVTSVVGPPVTEKKKTDGEKENEVEGDDPAKNYPDIGIEYNRYLKEVVQILESDTDFKKKLETANEEDIRSGKIARELEFVHHNVRTKLDEVKRQELGRLRHMAIQEYERTRGMDRKKLKIPGHVDHRNPHTFEMEDLRKLILQTTKDLEEYDRKRREEFKQYEMEKEFERKEKLKALDEEHRKAAEQEYEEMQRKHNDHPQMHHPGSKHQLEQVWEEQDHMSPEDFNPKTFFYLHDLDGNGHWDMDEVKALFKKELDKVYDPNAPEDDIRERQEEMERMREHVFNETDTDRDSLISLAEFMEQTRKSEFEQDPGWDTVDQQTQYSQQEYQNFEQKRLEEIQRMIEQGLISPSHMGYPAYGGGPMGVPGHGAPLPQGHGYPQPQGHGYPQPQHQSQGQGYPQPQHQSQGQGYRQSQGQGYPQPQGHGYPQAQGQQQFQQQQHGGYQHQMPQHHQQQQMHHPNQNPSQGHLGAQQGQQHVPPPAAPHQGLQQQQQQHQPQQGVPQHLPPQQQFQPPPQQQQIQQPQQEQQPPQQQQQQPQPPVVEGEKPSEQVVAQSSTVAPPNAEGNQV